MIKTSELATGELTEKGINKTAHHVATVLKDQGSLKSQEGESEGSAIRHHSSNSPSSGPPKPPRTPLAPASQDPHWASCRQRQIAGVHKEAGLPGAVAPNSGRAGNTY